TSDLNRTLKAVLQKAGGKHLSDKEWSTLRSVTSEKLAGMEPEKLRLTLVTLVPILQKAMYQERFSPEIESAFERVRTAVKEIPSKVQADAKTGPAHVRAEEEEFAETPESERAEGRERAQALMHGIKETGKVPSREAITSKVDVDRARNAVIGILPKLVQTLEKHGIKISEHPDDSERQLLKEIATGTLKDRISEELSEIVEDTIAAIGHGYTIAETGPGHVPEDVKRDIEGLKSARQTLAAFAKEAVAGREKTAQITRAKEAETAQHKERFGKRVQEFEPVFGGKEERRAKFDADKKAKREELTAARGRANVEFEKEVVKRGTQIRRDKSLEEVISSHPKIQEKKRLAEIAEREKTLGQSALEHAITQAFEIGGKPFINFLGADSDDSKFLTALRDQKPASFKPNEAEDAISVIKDAFDDDVPEDIAESIAVLEERIKSVNKLATTPPAEWR
ncbi:MAG: hypothetical protein LLG04_02150, partial [Parachlamydia sp.]|nr:hypothetical protein [Parachlamydia sp.]